MSVIKGVVWGLVLGGTGVAVASVIAPQPAGNAPPASVPQVTTPETAALTELSVDEPQAPGDAGTVEAGAVPQVAVPEPVAPAIDADTAPLDPPDTAEVAAVPEAPALAEDPDVTTEAADPVLPAPQSLAPEAPGAEANVVVDATPAAPVEVVEDTAADDSVVVEAIEVETPDVVDAADAAAPVSAESATANSAAAEVASVAVETVDLTEAESITSAEAEAVSSTAADVVAPSNTADPVAVSDATDVVETRPAEDVAAEATTADRVDAVTDSDAIETATAENAAPVAPTDTAEADTTAELAETVVAEAEGGVIVAPGAVNAETAESVISGAEVVDDTPTEAPSVVAQTEPVEEPAAPVVVNLVDGGSSSLPQGDSGVRINRVGQVAEEPVTEEPAEEQPATGVALVDYAADFDNPDGKPLLSLILLDNGSIDAGPALLGQLPFAVTVLVEAGAADAAEKMASYRAAGIEAGAAISLPTGATAADVEIALEAARASLGEAVVVTDLGTAERAARDQLITALAGEGRGFISLSKGLSNGLREAEVAGVPAAAIFRDLDADGQDARVIRRFLDQAAFRARQESGVVLLGRVRPDTLSALTLWGGANRADQVVMAPISAVLLAED